MISNILARILGIIYSKKSQLCLITRKNVFVVQYIKNLILTKISALDANVSKELGRYYRALF